MASVEIAGVRKSFGTNEVLHGVDLNIEDRAFVVLVGPSGCGKSTLLRLIAGLEEVNEGEIRIGGRNVNGVSPRDRDVAMVFQNYALYPHMSVFDNMAFSLKLSKVEREAIQQRVMAAAEMLDLVPFLDRYPKQLSGGQVQRVAMGRAIVRQPQAFLFDEPLSNLDANLRVQLRSEIKELHQRLGTTSIYVTHDQIEAMTMADTMVVLDQGNIAQIGAPLDVYDHPVNMFVARFIGSPAMNFITGTFRSADGAASVVTEGGTSLLVPQKWDLTEGRRVVYGIRPEHLAFDPASDLSVEVVVVEPTGTEILVKCLLGGVEVKAVFHERHALAPGERIGLKPTPEHIYLFDAETGLRLS